MKVLYAIQATGNGHLSRATEIIPFMKKHAEVDLIVSGTHAEVEVGHDIRYRHKGFGFLFGTKGGIDFKNSLLQADVKSLLKDIKNLPLKEYDLIVNDFEPITAWACRMQKRKSIALSHQSAFLSSRTPVPKGLHWGSVILKNYAPTTEKIGFHFERYDEFIHTPVIRRDIRRTIPTNLGHYTVYLPAYGDDFIILMASKHPNIKWEIFSKHSKKSYAKDNVNIYPINKDTFEKSLASCDGFVTGGGFEGPAEALFLGKKILVVPMNHQYEQQCNALALENLGVPVVWKQHDLARELSRFVNDENRIIVNFPDETEEIITNLLNRYLKL